MTLRTICDNNNNNILTIPLPEGFKNSTKVIVIIDDDVTTKEAKIELMKLAAQDPLYLKDMEEANNDFEAIDFETL